MASPHLLFALFALSGFTGLVYESVWSHYLKLFLGSAAFAQSFVLVAFMGGLALGAWLASRFAARRNLLASYGAIEGLIGLAALLFHPVFTALVDLSLERAIPALGDPVAIEVYKYALSALLIVPQTVLLGMTFPLMSGAVIRRYPTDRAGREAGGHHLATLYFSNSIGAAAGALLAAFVLIGWLGMQGAMNLAGALNLALAMLVMALARGVEPAPRPAARVAAASLEQAGLVRLFLVAAGITGAASFIYEIAWIRMLSLVLGSSFHAFELMLSAFITGLALGGLWIRKRIDRIGNPVRFSGLVQVAMGIAALGTVFVYQWSFDSMAWALGALQRNASGYPLFMLFSHAIAFAVMLPATFLAGMTLPLFTHTLMRGGQGERAIGQVYAANTLGAIAGVLLAVHLLVPGAGLKLTLVLGAVLDIVLGAWLLRRSGLRLDRVEAFAGLVLGLLAAGLTLRAAALEPARLASGVFRHGVAYLEQRQILFYRDGKTASVAVHAGRDGVRTISTNGKPDASIQMNAALPRQPDEDTMVMLGALPLLARPNAQAIANIGFGSGLTAETLLAHSGPRSVDSIEIEPAMAAGAKAFLPRVDRVFRDPRSALHFEDAKSFFARHGKRYDLIVSEPSNPWVNGVASLFTVEFYRHAIRHLAPNGLFVQWLHIYELDDRLLGSMLAALGAVFPDYDVYQSNDGDLVVLAARDGQVPLPGEFPSGEAAFVESLRQVGLSRREHLLARRLGGKHEIGRLLAQLKPGLNSDFDPMVQLGAPRARFLGRSADAIVQLALAPLPILEMLGDGRQTHLAAPAPPTSPGRAMRQNAALDLHHTLTSPQGALGDRPVAAALLGLRAPGALCAAQIQRSILEQLHLAAELSLAHLGPSFRKDLWIEPAWIGCPPANTAPALRERLAVYRAVAQRDARAMLELARGLLERPKVEGLDWARFLLMTATLGAQASGQGDEARRLWARHAPALLGANLGPADRYLAEWRP
jgi:spermidine synthase